uniref:Si:ch211-153b23.7 n=1 Tax=Hucho hucho TaxID=62062 RepID=A0A4W5R7E3_9TELE
MDRGSLSASPSSSEQEEDSSPYSASALLQNPEENGAIEESRAKVVEEEIVPAGERLLSGEDQGSLITDSMSVTSADQEKLLLLNRNTELRRVNKELMKLNEDWDHVYRSTTLSLQQRVETLEQESNTVQQLNNTLLLKVDHEQNKREYYERTLMQELKKNQQLHEYVRLLENRLHHTDTTRDWTKSTQTSLSTVTHLPETTPISDAPGGSTLSPSLSHGSIPGLSSSSSSSHGPPSHLFSSTPDRGAWSGGRISIGPYRALEDQANPQKEVQDLKEQLEALRCQTEIYEADYQTEHKDHKHTQQENKRLRRTREEMRQQMALLQEQLKVYEDDFRKERSDKQVLQRLLMKKSPALVKQPVLVHRCNNEQQPAGGDRRRQREEQRDAQTSTPQPDHHHPLCPKHCERRNTEESP